MQRLWQLIPLFTTGFLVSRMVARTRLADRLVGFFLSFARGRVSRLLLGVMVSAALLSLFIPNMLTVLVLLPAMERLREQNGLPGSGMEKLMTPLALALIYGANIGGMGSLVGSPANALMLGALELYRVPAREAVEFISWLIWGIPLVMAMLLAAWGVLVAVFVRGGRGTARLNLKFTGPGPMLPHERFAMRLGIWTALFWLFLSALTVLLPGVRFLWDGLAAVFGVLFLYLAFARPSPSKDGRTGPLLSIRDTFRGLPLRGLAFAALAVGVSALLVALGLDSWMAGRVSHLVPSQPSPFLLYLAFVLLTIFATEVLTNTAAAVALFPLASSVSTGLGLHPLPAMMGVALASTCAFMSPLATPVNGLAFGGVRGVSLRKMLAAGFAVNLIGGLLLALFLTFVISLFYGI